ncbi:hypothetical protein C8Q76DRAFT_605681, partial [Earliella scabrosa]
ILTTPNQDWVPQCPSEHAVRAYTDGTWGLHEYSRWPQFAARNMRHVACIPTRQGNRHLPEVLWTSLAPDRDWVVGKWCGFGHVGFLASALREQLEHAAQHALTRADELRSSTCSQQGYVRELCLVLHQCIERMRRLPAPAATAVAIGAHIQRLCLELLGLHTYITIVLPCLESDQLFHKNILPVIGTFVRDLQEAANFVRAGVPTWVLQRPTSSTRIWRVVPCTHPPWIHSATSGNDVKPMAQIGSDGENWLSSMVFAISTQLCDSECPRLPALTRDDKPKRSRLMVVTKNLTLPAHPAPHRHSNSSPRGPLYDTDAATSVPGRNPVRHPSREHMPSPFYDVPLVWARALESLGCLPTPRHSVAYFYPPPFLLDTVCPAAPVPRYLHHLARIREYCRVRLMDTSLDGRPLTIAEWRTALWGDYADKPEPVVRGPAGVQRRVKRKHHERSAIGRLFGEDACLQSYDIAHVPTLEGQPVPADIAATKPWVRMRLVWEAHEINWRCEVMALDSVMLCREELSAVNRWAREAQISAIWGLPSAMMSVLPVIPAELRAFCWAPPTQPGWTECWSRLAAFVAVISRWDGCPMYLRNIAEGHDDWTADEYDTIQTAAAEFYCQTFAHHFHRLPIIPIEFPDHLVYP